MTVGIYGIFDAETDECLYVGCSSNVEERYKQHLKHLKYRIHKRKDFVEWYHVNGAKPDLLIFRILEECENNDVSKNTLEIKWFSILNPKYYGQKPSLNNKMRHSEETRLKISNSMKKTLRETEILIDENIVLNDKKSSINRKCKFSISIEGLEKLRIMAKDPSVSLKKAGEFFNCSRFTISKIVKENNIEWICRRSPHFEDEDILKMFFEDKMTTREIAEKLNISQPAVIYRFNKFRDDQRFEKTKERYRVS